MYRIFERILDFCSRHATLFAWIGFIMMIAGLTFTVLGMREAMLFSLLGIIVFVFGAKLGDARRSGRRMS